MEQVFEYTYDNSAYITKLEFVDGYSLNSWRRTHLRDLIESIIFLSAASYSAYRAELLVFLIVFVALLGLSLVRLATIPNSYKKSIAATIKDRKEESIRLVVNDDGLQETTDGIVSFVPWSSVISYSVFKDILFIELKARLWSVIPRHSLSPASSPLEQLIEQLKNKGVNRRVGRNE